MPEDTVSRLQIKFDWKASALVLMLLPVTMSLGFWQLDRAEEKRQIQALFQQRQNNGPVPIEQLDENSDLRYQPVELQGNYLNDKWLLLDNRINHGKFGYEIVTPFKLTNSNLVVFINRGWVPGDISRRTLPSITAVDNEVELVGEIYVPQGQMMVLESQPITEWSTIVQSIDVKGLASKVDGEVFPHTVRINEFSPGAYKSNWMVVNVQPAKHTAYAVQWFAMTFTLLIIAFLSNTNSWALLKARK